MACLSLATSLSSDAESMPMWARPSITAMMPSIVRLGMTVSSCPEAASIAASCGSMIRRLNVVEPCTIRGSAMACDRIATADSIASAAGSRRQTCLA